MKILAIGDPHGALEKIKKIPIKKIDLILLTGDLGKADLARKVYFKGIKRKQMGLPKLEDNAKTAKAVYNEIHSSTIGLLKYLSKLSLVYTIQGNVGIPGSSKIREDYKKYGLKFKSTKREVKKIKNVFIIKNRLKIFRNIRIGFLEYFVDTSWIKEFRPINYRRSMKKALKQTKKARRILSRFKNIDILVCHQPPYKILDKVNFPGVPKDWKGKHAGSKAVLDYIKKHHPKLVLCGHIHEAKGEAFIGKTKVINLGCCGDYKVIEKDV